MVAVEEDEALARAARERLRALGAANVAVVQAPLSEGYPAEAPVRRDPVDGAVEFVPDALIRAAEGAEAAGGDRARDRVSRAMLYERVGEDAAKWPLFDAWAPLLPGFERKREFVF